MEYEWTADDLRHAAPENVANERMVDAAPLKNMRHAREKIGLLPVPATIRNTASNAEATAASTNLDVGILQFHGTMKTVCSDP